MKQIKGDEMRLTLENYEVASVIVALENSGLEENKELAEKIRNQFTKPIKQSKRNATKKAIEVKKQATQDKITNAVNLMRLEGEKITAYSVAKKAGISYNSAKKYSYLFQIDVSE